MPDLINTAFDSLKNDLRLDYKIELYGQNQNAFFSVSINNGRKMIGAQIKEKPVISVINDLENISESEKQKFKAYLKQRLTRIIDEL